MELKDKVAIVTGVSKGIGAATVQALLDSGSKVAGWGRTEPNFNHENFHFFQCDVSDWDAVQETYIASKEALGTPAVLVNNAGLGFQALVEETSVEQWRQMFDINVHGLFYCIKAAVPDMKAQELGHIINIASIAGTTGVETMSGYVGTKHAVRGISHSIYKELRNFGIKVTTIYPGSVKTNFFDEIDSIQANDNMMMPEDIAGTILDVLQTSGNYHVVDVEVRPLRPKGRK